MHIFIDESGSFTGFHEGSISVVGALAIPDVLLSRIEKKYDKFRKDLPKENGEVKGRLLKEKQVDKIVTLLARNEAVFEVTALDLGLHEEAAARDYQKKLGEVMLAKVPNFREDVRPEVQAAGEYISPINLFLQAFEWQNIHRLMIHENDKTCIEFVLFQKNGDAIHKPSYVDVVHDGFTNGGRLMLTKRNMVLAINIKGSKPVIAV